MPRNIIHYGVVGLGRAGWSIHVEGICRRRDAKIVAVADPLRQRRVEATEQLGCRAYESLAALLKNDQVEVVILATPSVRHGPDTFQALRAGKHVIVEKPMAVSVTQADRMIDAAKKARRKLFVHHSYRYQPVFAHLMDVIKSGIVGRVFHVQLHESSFSRRYDWQTLASNAGGVLNNKGPHYIDMMLQMMGSPVVQVMGDLQQISSAGNVEDHVVAFMRAKNGCTGELTMSTALKLEPPPPFCVICGDCGTLVTDRQTSTIHYFDRSKLKPLKAVDGAVMSRQYESQDLPWRTKTIKSIGPKVGDFYDNVYDVLRRRAAMHISPQAAREVVRVMDLIRKGSKFTGRRTRLAR